jgi:hypothetical protein
MEQSGAAPGAGAPSVPPQPIAAPNYQSSSTYHGQSQVQPQVHTTQAGYGQPAGAPPAPPAQPR